MTSITDVFVIGGGHAGLGIAKQILKTIPNVKVTVFSTSRDYYFNLVSPRLLARPEAIPLDDILIPIEKLFRRHPKDQFEFVHATVTEISPKAKSVTTEDKYVRRYDYLVVASGSHTLGVINDPCIPLKQTISDTLRESIPQAQKVIANARRIVIGGGGPVGIELAGEIADVYPSKTVTMVFAGFRLLDNLKGSASIEAGKKLNRLGLVVRSGAKVKYVSFNEKNNDWTVYLTDGTSLETDLYIPAIGVLPNNSFIPTSLLSQTGYLKCDEHFAAKGVSCIYAVGDIVEGQPKMAAYIKSHISVVVKNLTVDITGVGVKQILNPPMINGILVPIGKAGGTGQIGSFVPWSWIVSYLKGDFGLSMISMFVSEK